MPKRVPNKKYTPEFKKLVVETMLKGKLGYSETAERFEIRHKRVQDWERIYLEEGPEGLAIEHRDRGSTGRPKKLPKAVEEDLLTEVQRLRAENEYLKNLQALVLEDERRQRKNAGSSKAEAQTFSGDTSHNRSTAPCNLLMLRLCRDRRIAADYFLLSRN